MRKPESRIVWPGKVQASKNLGIMVLAPKVYYLVSEQQCADQLCRCESWSEPLLFNHFIT